MRKGMMLPLPSLDRPRPPERSSTVAPPPPLGRQDPEPNGCGILLFAYPIIGLLILVVGWLMAEVVMPWMTVTGGAR